MCLVDMGKQNVDATMESFETRIDDLVNAISNKSNIDIEKCAPELVASIKGTMSDQGPVNPGFNKRLFNKRADIIEGLIKTWDIYIIRTTMQDMRSDQWATSGVNY